MTVSGSMLASIAAPIQWLLFAGVVGAILAPHFIPPLARAVGRGINRASRRRRPRAHTHVCIPPDQEAASSSPDTDRAVWGLWLIVGVFAAVLSWFLLRSR